MTKEQIVDSVFRSVPESRLLEYFKKMALNDSAIAQDMKIKFLDNLSWDYKKEIEYAFHELIVHKIYGDEKHDWNAITENCKRILSKAFVFVNAGDYNKAVDVGLTLLETLEKTYDYSEIEEFPDEGEYWRYDYDEDEYDSGEVGFAKDTAEFIVDVLVKGKDTFTDFNSLLKRFKDVAISLSTCGMDEEKEPLKAYKMLAKVVMTDEDLFNEKISILDSNDSQDTAVEIYEVLVDKEICGWTLDKFAKKYVRFNEIAIRYEKLLEDNGRIDEAVELLEMHSSYDTDRSELAQKYYQLLERTGNVEKQIKQALIFFDSWNSDKLRYYHDLKKIVSAEKWPAVLKKILSCEKGADFSWDWLFPVYLEEGMKEELRNRLLSLKPDRWERQGDTLNKKIEYFLRYKEVFSDTSRDVVSNMFTLELYNTAPYYDTKTYNTLVSSAHMLSMVDENSKNRMNQFVNHLKTEFSRRPRLMEKIRNWKF